MVHVESCDPGTTTQVGNDDSQVAMSLRTTRSLIGARILRSGTAATPARCLAGWLVRAFPVSRLLDPTFGEGSPAVQTRIRALAAACG